MNIRQIARDSAHRHMAVLAEIEEGLPIPVIPCEDELRHTVDHPYCSDYRCPCHHDGKYETGRMYDEGLATYEEAMLLLQGKNI